jgi:hypothetical protein
MNLNKNCLIGGLSWAKVLSFILLFVVLLYPDGMTGKALVQQESYPWGIVTIRGCSSWGIGVNSLFFTNPHTLLKAACRNGS